MSFVCESDVLIDSINDDSGSSSKKAANSYAYTKFTG